MGFVLTVYAAGALVRYRAFGLAHAAADKLGESTSGRGAYLFLPDGLCSLGVAHAQFLWPLLR